jgi:hypothetical protein
MIGMSAYFLPGDSGKNHAPNMRLEKPHSGEYGDSVSLRTVPRRGTKDLATMSGDINPITGGIK